MDGDMWAARLLSKRQYAVHSILDQHLNVDDVVEGDEELRPDYACPYCFEALDLLAICSHLEDEHFNETRVVLCPVCATKVAKDLTGHITLHHGSLFKFQRRRKFRRPGITSHSNFPLNGKELSQAHIQALLGACAPSTRAGSGIPDLLLSSLVCNLPISECDDSSKLNTDSADAPPKTSVAPVGLSSDDSLTAEEREQKLEEATIRSKFVRQLIISTLWQDS